MTRGLVIGKFYPPHAGHDLLIDTARAHCDSLTVLVCAKPAQTIPGIVRGAWLREAHLDVDVRVIEDRLDDDDTAAWAAETLRHLGRAPDVVFTSEAYGVPYSALMGARHVAVDPHRTLLPISATAIRADPRGNARFLRPAVQAYYVPRVVLAGAESSGKSTLARALAERLGVPRVDEYGREYTLAKYRDAMLTGDWRPEEFVHIAREQERREDAAGRTNPGCIIADTDAFVTTIWYERYLGAGPAPEGWPPDRAQRRTYLVSDPHGVPFEQDGIRDGEAVRAWMHRRTIDALTARGAEFFVLRGSYEERLTLAASVAERSS